MRRIFAACIAATSFVSAVEAQSVSDDELLGLFRAQLDAVQAVTENGLTRGLSDNQGRGLTLVTESQDTESADSGTIEVAPTGDGLTSLADIKSGTVVRFDERLEFEIRIKFDHDSAALSQSQQPALDQMCRVMQRAQEIKLFRIVGHTDSSGPDDYNEGLSQLRAEEVGRHLINNCGIAETRLEMVGYGERFLDNPSDPKAAENRRVEFQALS